MRSPLDLGPWAGPGYGLGLLIGTTALETRVAGHTGKGPGSVIAVYHAVDRTPPSPAVNAAAVADPGSVEHAAFAALRG
jgi:hypothetical protein